MSFFFARKKRLDKRLIRGTLLGSMMTKYEGMPVTADVSSGNMIFEPILEEGVFRFDCSADCRNAAFPSLSFVNAKDRDAPLMGCHKVPSCTPKFEIVLGKQIVNFELPTGTSLYGTGEVSGQLERTRKRVFTWNTDAWGYGPGTTSLYQSHPWVLAVFPNGEAMGILADTTKRCEIDLRKESTVKLIAPASYPIITFGPFASPLHVLETLAHAIDLRDPLLRTNESSFLLGPLLIYASNTSELREVQLIFGTHEEDLPAMYLQAGSIIPLCPYQHVGEATPTDDLSLLVALDESGKAKGVLFEDDGDGYEYTKGGYLLTTYMAELQSTVVTVRISKIEGSWKRPNHRIHVHLLLGKCAMIDAWGIDGEDLEINMPSEDEVANLVFASEKSYKTRMETATLIPDVENISGQKGVELSRTPVDMKHGDWALKVVPWIGGRIISMVHLPSGTQWLHSRVELDGYEEYSSVEYRSAGCSEEYTVIGRDLEQAGKIESLKLEGDIGGGLVLERLIYFPEDDPKVLMIDSRIVARNVGAGSGGFSRIVCLRVHPVFTLVHPTESYVSFVSINGSKHEIWPEPGEQFYEGNLRPNGEWVLVDKCLGVGLVNRFDVNQV